MEQLEVINKIKEKEQLAQKIIEEAENRASLLIQEAKITKRKEFLRAAEGQADKEIHKLKQDFIRQTQESIRKIEEDKKQSIDKINSLASKNKDKARDYIVHQILNLWQLQR